MKLPIILLFSLFFFACDQTSTQVANLERETGTIHDEAMKDLADMQRVVRGIKAQLNSGQLSPEKVKVYADLLQRMNKADETMSNWMVNYKPSTGMDPKEALAYLQEQKQLIEQNKKDIEEATQAGKTQLTKP